MGVTEPELAGSMRGEAWPEEGDMPGGKAVAVWRDATLDTEGRRSTT